MSFTSIFRRALKPVDEIPASTVSTLRNAKTGIRSVDDVFGTLNYSLVDRQLAVNGVKLHTVESLLRRGELASMFSKLNKPTAITVADELKFRKLIDTPDIRIRNMEETVKSARIIHPDLDIVVTSASDLERLPKASRTKLKGIVDNLWSTVKVGGVAVGIFAAISIGVPYYEKLVEATVARNGFYLVVLKGGKTTSFKVPTRSCLSTSVTGVKHISAVKYDHLDNPVLYLLHTINDPSAEMERQSLTSVLGGVTPTMETFETIVQNDTLFAKVSEHYYHSSEGHPLKNPCDLVQTADKAKVPCTGFDPNADEKSYAYVNTYTLPDNMTFKCVTNSTLLETIVDAAGDAAHYILGSTFMTKLGSYLKYILLAVVAVVLVIIGRFVYVKFNLGDLLKGRGRGGSGSGVGGSASGVGSGDTRPLLEDTDSVDVDDDVDVEYVD
nr:odv-e56 structural protein [Heliothis virescens nudivirus]